MITNVVDCFYYSFFKDQFISNIRKKHIISL